MQSRGWGVAEIAQQWPLLAGFLAVAGLLLRIIQRQYEERIEDLKEAVELWRELALSGTDLADRMTTVVERERRHR